MGRPSNRFMAESVSTAIALCLSGAPEAGAEWNRSGNERADFTRHLHEIDPACIVCGLDTEHTTWKSEQAAVLIHLVPASVIGCTGRGGYIGGNVGLGCRACADAIGVYLRRGGEWSADLVSAFDLDRVPITWPVLNRTYRIPTPDARRLATIIRNGETHGADARDARRERGLPF